MSHMKRIWEACMENRIDPNDIELYDLEQINLLTRYFNNLEHAVEAYAQGFTVEELKNKGDFNPYWIYLIWVKS